MTDQRRIPSKIKPRCSLHVSIEPALERGLIIEAEEKPYCFSVSVV